jgi:hypothetical protein
MNKFIGNLTMCLASGTSDRDRIPQYIPIYGIFPWNLPGKGGFCIQVIGFPTKLIAKPAPTHIIGIEPDSDVIPLGYKNGALHPSAPLLKGGATENMCQAQTQLAQHVKRETGSLKMK